MKTTPLPLELPFPEPLDSVSLPRDLKALAEAAERYVMGALPIGSIMPYMQTTAPPGGWHLCDGSPHGSTALQAVIGSATTPDLRGRFLIGAGSAYSLNSSGGSETAQVTAGNLGPHSHTGTSGAGSADHSHTGQPPNAATTTNSLDHTHGLGGAGIPPHVGWWTGQGAALDIVYAGNPTPDQGAAWDFPTDTLPAGNHGHGAGPFAVGVAAANDPHTHAPVATAAAGAGATVDRPNMPSFHALTYIIKGG